MIHLLLLSASTTAWAVPVQVPVQGQLSDSAGRPVAGALDMTFRLHGDLGATTPLYTETTSVSFDQGVFSTQIGQVQPLDSELFRLDQQVWLTVQMAGDVEMDPITIGWAPLSSFAAHAADAETLDGLGSADFLASSWRPSWTDIQGRPPGLDDGDDIGGGLVDTDVDPPAFSGYVIGGGLLLVGDTLSVDPAAIDTWARAAAYDAPAELHAELDGRYLSADADIAGIAADTCYDEPSELHALLDPRYRSSAWRPLWSEIDGMPLPFADGTDDSVAYHAGDGLLLDGETFSVDPVARNSAIAAIAYDQPSEILPLCLDTEQEVHDLIADDYLPASWLPDWSDIQDIPYELFVEDSAEYLAGAGLLLDGVTFSLDSAVVSGIVRGAAYDTPSEIAPLCFDTEPELRAALDDDYRPAAWTPAWTDVGSIPAGFADGTDDIGPWYAGDGLRLDDTTFRVDGPRIQALAREVCFDTELEIHALLDADFLPIYYRPAWTDIVGIPTGFADATDDVSTYTAGVGLRLVDHQFQVDGPTISTWAEAVCYDQEAELHAVLDDDYLPAGWIPDWSDLTSVPAELADGDDDAWSDFSCPDGLSPIRFADRWDCADLTVSYLTGDDITELLVGADLTLGSGTTVDGTPLTWSTYTDEDAVAAVSAAFPGLNPLRRDPLILMGLDRACIDTYAGYGGILRFPAVFDNTPSLVATSEDTLDSMGSNYLTTWRIGPDRAVLKCSNRSEGTAWLGVERGTWTVDEKMVQAGYDNSVSSGDTLTFPTPFPQPPIVLIMGENLATWLRVSGPSGPSTTSFQVNSFQAGQPMHWIAMEPGEYHHGRYHWEAVKFSNPDNNDRIAYQQSYRSMPSVVSTILDTNSSGATYQRVIDVSQTDFQIYVDSDQSEFLFYVAFEEER